MGEQRATSLLKKKNEILEILSSPVSVCVLVTMREFLWGDRKFCLSIQFVMDEYKNE